MGIMSLIITTMLPGLINLAEAAYAKRQNSSHSKLNVVLTGARRVAQVLASDQVAHGMPTDAELIAAIEQKLAAMKAEKSLVPPVAPLAPRAA